VSEPDESSVIINNVPLSVGQVMTIRVALTDFVLRMENDALGDDEHGKRMTKAYRERAVEVLKLMIGA
jgi:hypothetical protein